MKAFCIYTSGLVAEWHWVY